MFINAVISTLVKIVIGWICIDRIPTWLGLSGILATIIKVIGVLIIISALLDWV